MATKQKHEDATRSIIERIMSTPVPDNGQLKHPIQPKTRSKTGQVSITDVAIMAKSSGLPEDIKEWNTRNFVDYFAKRYQDETGGNYRKVYRSDCVAFQQLGKFMSSNGLERNLWTKKSIEWAFQRRDYIMRKKGHFTPHEIASMVNYFYQDEVLPKVATGDVERNQFDVTLLNEINEAMKQGKERQIFSDFGIPVAATYMVNVKQFAPNVVESGIRAMLNILSKGTIADHEKLGRIVLASVIGSPYPPEFELLDWRTSYANLIAPFISEDWYRANDYQGQPLNKYFALLGSKGA